MPAATKFVDQTEFHRLARARRGGGTPVYRPEARVLRAADDGGRVIPWVLSDGSVDRVGDVLNPNGWQLAGYRANPVVLFAHDAMAPPIGRAINVRSDGLRLLGDVLFADGSVYDFADTVFKLIKGGFIRAGSVGFMPLDWDWANDNSRPSGIDLRKMELLEFSIVPVPANANALVEARAKGIDTRPLVRWAEQVLDERRSVGMSRTTLDGLRQRAKEPARLRIARALARMHVLLAEVEKHEQANRRRRALAEARALLARTAR